MNNKDHAIEFFQNTSNLVYFKNTLIKKIFFNVKYDHLPLNDEMY